MIQYEDAPTKDSTPAERAAFFMNILEARGGFSESSKWTQEKLDKLKNDLARNMEGDLLKLKVGDEVTINFPVGITNNNFETLAATICLVENNDIRVKVPGMDFGLNETARLFDRNTGVSLDEKGDFDLHYGWLTPTGAETA